MARGILNISVAGQEVDGKPIGHRTGLCRRSTEPMFVKAAQEDFYCNLAMDELRRLMSAAFGLTGKDGAIAFITRSSR